MQHTISHIFNDIGCKKTPFSSVVFIAVILLSRMEQSGRRSGMLRHEQRASADYREFSHIILFYRAMDPAIISSNISLVYFHQL